MLTNFYEDFGYAPDLTPIDANRYCGVRSGISGEPAVSGVSLVEPIVQLIIYIFSAMASDGVTVAGQYLGSKNY